MTYDEAFDLTRDDEIVEEFEIDPPDAGDPDRPLTDEEVFDLWKNDPNRYRDEAAYDDEDFDRILRAERERDSLR